MMSLQLDNYGLTLSSYPRMISLGFPNLSFTQSSVIVAPKETNLAVTEPSGAEMVVRSKGYKVAYKDLELSLISHKSCMAWYSHTGPRRQGWKGRGSWLMRRMQRESWRVRFSFREENERRCGRRRSATILELPPSALYWNEQALCGVNRQQRLANCRTREPRSMQGTAVCENDHNIMKYC